VTPGIYVLRRLFDDEPLAGQVFADRPETVYSIGDDAMFKIGTLGRRSPQRIKL
jgi:hypothetical protein